LKKEVRIPLINEVKQGATGKQRKCGKNGSSSSETPEAKRATWFCKKRGDAVGDKACCFKGRKGTRKKYEKVAQGKKKLKDFLDY